jgi:ATP-binding cassette subfamily F protein 3
MSLINLDHVFKAFGARDILKDVSWAIEERRRIGLIGPNGAGKTTLFKMLLAQEEPTSGNIARAKTLSIGYLSQHPTFPEGHTLHQEMLLAQPELSVIEEAMAKAEAEMADPAVAADADKLEKVMERYAKLQDEFQAKDGYSYEARVDAILHGMEFSKKDYDRKLSSFSGGEQTRLMLAKLLLTSPQLLLLDEPTNHLDVETCEWLEGFLKEYEGTLICISHDRYFLDRVVTEIVELEDCDLTEYPGNYTQYKKFKAEELEQAIKEYELQKAHIARTEEFIRRNIAGQNTKQAQGRRKMLAKLERMERPTTREKKISLTFNSKGASGKEVVTIEGVSKTFGERQLFAPFDGHIYRQQRVGLIGPNGCGKSTFVKILCGKEPASAGKAELGHGVALGYYDQFQTSLSPQNRAMDEIWNLIPQAPQQEVRGVLGRFLFPGDDVEKKVASLSGGEKARLMLAKLVLEGPNFLVLDEPTNHLDISSREVVEEALDEFEGTLLMVSHDRYFLDREATHIWEIRDGRVYQFVGNYTAWHEEKKKGGKGTPLSAAPAPREESKPAPKPEPKPEPKREPSPQKLEQKAQQQHKKRQAELEKSISDLEKKKAAMQDEFANPELAKNPENMKQLKAAYAQLEEELAFLFNKWQELEERTTA